jgi:hypothetical protein
VVSSPVEAGMAVSGIPASLAASIDSIAFLLCLLGFLVQEIGTMW